MYHVIYKKDGTVFRKFYSWGIPINVPEGMYYKIFNDEKEYDEQKTGIKIKAT